MQPIMKAGFFALAVACAMPVCAQQVYQWKDEQGKTHFSDVPPPAEQAENVKALPKQYLPTPTQQPSTQTNWAERELQFQERREKAAEAKAQAEQQRQQQEERDRVCSQVHNTLASLKSGVRVARPNEKGEREFLDDKARAQEIERAQKFVDTNCK